eukprot:TRINITY_DN6938_c0_g1_i4.p1 TRINITY_DN6938_c0_g1~~TRINITY_DN6938_c0_g1_i4.p1  ORF type:complete len:350 (-),score=56.99 TRINITY_DN6938_c0_g1_i4:96-1145(-)
MVQIYEHKLSEGSKISRRRRLAQGRQVIEGSDVLQSAVGAGLSVGRAALTEKGKGCGDSPYTSRGGTILEVSSSSQCSDAEPSAIVLSSEGQPGVLLSAEAFNETTDPLVHVVHREVNPHASDALNSAVLDVTLEDRQEGSEVPVHGLEKGITIILARRNNSAVVDDVESNLEPRCEYFDESAQSWSDKGCSVVGITDTQIECLCTHLTSFAAVLRKLVAPVIESNTMSRTRSYDLSKETPQLHSKIMSPSLQTKEWDFGNTRLSSEAVDYSEAAVDWRFCRDPLTDLSFAEAYFVGFFVSIVTCIVTVKLQQRRRSINRYKRTKATVKKQEALPNTSDVWQSTTTIGN